MLKYFSYFFGNSFDEVKLMTHTFKGGVHPNYMKAPQVPISVVTPPPEVVIPMVQHIGAPCKPLVAKGDYVKMGQKIGENPAPVSAPVHAFPRRFTLRSPERLSRWNRGRIPWAI